MEQRVSLITLAVEDVASATRFYENMGWKQVESPDGIVVFDLIGQALGLYPKQALADEIGLQVQQIGQGGCVLSYNCREKSEVAQMLQAAQDAGGKILKPASDVFWGGHHGHFSDPEGHIWEVAFNPFSTLRADGAFCWNGY